MNECVHMYICSFVLSVDILVYSVGARYSLWLLAFSHWTAMSCSSYIKFSF